MASADHAPNQQKLLAISRGPNYPIYWTLGTLQRFSVCLRATNPAGQIAFAAQTAGF
jgi:hypothetical protein